MKSLSLLAGRTVYCMYFQTIYPCRLGLCNLVNTGAVVETVGAIVRPFLSEKLRNRVSNGSMENKLMLI